MGKYDEQSSPFFKLPDQPPPYPYGESQGMPMPGFSGTAPAMGFTYASGTGPAHLPNTNPMDYITGDSEEAGNGSANNSRAAVKRQKIQLYGSSKELRNTFLRNVYSIITAQAVVICGIITALFYIPHFRTTFAEASFFKFWFYWIGGIIGCCFTTVFYKLMRQPPVNLVLLTMITLMLGFLSGTLAARVEGHDDIIICVGVVACVCFCVVIFTFQTKVYFTPIVSVLYVWSLLFIAFGILALSYSGTIVDAAVLMIAPSVFCTYIVVTTQLLVKNENRALYSHEFVYGAVQIVMFVVVVFAKFLHQVYVRCCPLCSCCCKDCNICEDV